MITFGPVPSRRLGLSLGVNNIPPKHCTYSCIYCQIGKTINIDIGRKVFYNPDEIVREVILKVEGTHPDVVTFVPDGEPTLDLNIGEEIRRIKEGTNTPVAVITNSSLLFRKDVRNDLIEADIVSVKVDAVSEKIWRLVNRPHPSLKLQDILEGIRKFSDSFSGTLLTETMLVMGFNDSAEELKMIAEFLSNVNPTRVYISVPIRPPAEPWVQPPQEQMLSDAYLIFKEVLGTVEVELLTGYEGPEFRMGEDPEEYLKATTSVHPIRLDFARHFLRKKGYDPEKVIGKLVDAGELVITTYRGKEFLVRRLPRLRVKVEK